ncbi:MAG: sodium-dependent transporter, partial [Emergencia sp.]
EGFMMPGGCLIMVIILGWLRPNYLDDEVELSSSYKSRGFVKFCLKWVAPVFLAFILVGQMNSFFGLGWF